MSASILFLTFGSVYAAESNTVRQNQTIEQTAGQKKYDGRELGIITPVRDQGTSNLCWSYASSSASEAAVLKAGLTRDTADKLYLNPVATAYRAYKRTSDPLENTGGDWQSIDYMNAAGNPLKAVKLFSMWWGPVTGQNAAVDPFENPSFRFENGFYIPENKQNPEKYIEDIKRAVVKYGAVTFQYNNVREEKYYNPKAETGSASFPHACTVIGWDDDIPADSFSPAPASKNGGWLIKNSYSSLEYFYLSYDNTSSSVYAFTYAPAEKYDYNYYYDGNLDDFSLRNDKIIANVFEAKKGGQDGKSEVLKAVNAAVYGENITVTADIYTGLENPFSEQQDVPTFGGQKAAQVQKTFEHGGYVTLELDREVILQKGDWFSVIISVTNDAGDARVITAYKDSMTLSYSGNGFSKLTNCVGRIKAFTKLEDKNNQTSGTFTNLVVPARFDDEEEFISDKYGADDTLSIIDNSYNSAEYNISDYFENLSGGKIRIDSLFLMDGNGSAKLSKPRGYYAQKTEQNPEGYDGNGEMAERMYELKRDWGNAVQKAFDNGNLPRDILGNSYDISDLDKNRDGYIDSITILFCKTTQDISVEWASPLWNYNDRYGGVSLSDGKITSGGYVQITPDFDHLYRVSDGKPIFSIGTAAHETGHILGLHDLYNSSQSSPVYFMSAMAKHLSPVPQLISPKEREALELYGDGNLAEIALNGTYTLSTAAAKEGVTCYKLKLPGSAGTLYAEYRNFTENGDKYDNQKKNIICSDGSLLKGVNLKSGLVLYAFRGDGRFPDNMNGSAGRWNYEVLTGSFATKSDAALSAGEGFEVTDDIYISVEQVTDSSLTFSVEGLSEVHGPADKWLSDRQSHWKACTVEGCEEKFDVAYHSGGEATCITAAVCDVCGQSYREVNAENHKNIKLINERPADVLTDGYSGDEVCEDCQTTVKKGHTIPALHKYGDADLDGDVTVNDALTVLLACVKKIKLGQTAALCADVDRSGSVTAVDALLVLWFTVGKIDKLPL